MMIYLFFTFLCFAVGIFKTLCRVEEEYESEEYESEEEFEEVHQVHAEMYENIPDIKTIPNYAGWRSRVKVYVHYDSKYIPKEQQTDDNYYGGVIKKKRRCI